ncbi:hypothetical protein [Mesobacillus jeotgali]|uniref:hypothetical protein n=1 Tax=Mesobacillus jeotgali TaxID=129985 RepID=UPI0009A5A036|nr:hypothetical protein [Mesobacillus jeotgali]
MYKVRVKRILFRSKKINELWYKIIELRDEVSNRYRNLINKCHFKYLVYIKGYNEMKFEKKITNGMFKVFVCEATKKVIKVNKRDTYASNLLYKKLKNQKEYQHYAKVITSATLLDLISIHSCPVLHVYKDGGYESPLIKGVNLQILKLKLESNEIKLTNTEKDDYLEAIQKLYDNLREFYHKNNFIPGDWMLYNLVFEEETKTIINVDIEGFYNYQGFVPERINKLYFKELIALLKDSKGNTH